MGYQFTAIKSFSWVGLLRLMFRAAGFLRTAILARLLTPNQFGVFGIGTIVLGLVEMFTETGINVFLIQKNQDQAVKEYLHTAYTVSIVRGFLISLLIILTTPLILTFFNTPQALPILLSLSLVPLIRGFINPAIINFQKKLEFHKDFAFRSIIIATDAIIAIISALILKDPISLSLGLIASALVEVILSLIYVKPRPQLQFNQAQFREIIHQGKWITSAGITSYFALKLPDIAIGRVFNPNALGYYQMAYRFAILPIEEISEVINRVSFPLFVKIAGDKSRLKKAFTKNSTVSIGTSLIYSIIIFLLATPFTIIFLGPQWVSIVPLLRLMTIAGFLFALNNLTNPLILALGQQRQLSHLTFIRLTTILITIIPLTIWYGETGIIIALILSLTTPLPYRLYLLRKAL